MTACRNKASRAVTAALVGVLSVGAVPMVALAAGTTDSGAQVMADEQDAFANAEVVLNWNTKDYNGGKQAPEVVTVTPRGGKAIFDAQTSDDYKIYYVAADAEGKPGTESVTPVEAGTYYVVIEAVSGDYAGGKATEKFFISGKKLEVASYYEGNDVHNTTINYTAEPADINFSAPDGHRLIKGVDYTVKFYNPGDDASNAARRSETAPTDAGDYYAHLTGIGAYAGSTADVTFTINPFNLTTADVFVDTIIGADTALPTKPTTVNGSEALAAMLKLDYSDPTPNGTGAFKAMVVPDTDDKTSPNFTIGGHPVDSHRYVEVHRVDYKVGFTYNGEAVPETITLNVKKDNFIHDKMFGASYTDGDGNVVDVTHDIKTTVTDKDGNSLGSIKDINNWTNLYGTYTVTLEALDEAGHVYGGSVQFKIVVTDGTLDAEAGMYVSYDGTVISSFDRPFTGTPYNKFDVALYDGNDPVAVSDYSWKIVDSEGNEVPRKAPIHAGDYQIVVTSDRYQLENATFDLTISKMEVQAIRIEPGPGKGNLQTINGQYALPYNNGGDITPAWQYTTGERDAKGNLVWVDYKGSMVSRNSNLTVTTDEGDAVKNIREVGDYVATLSAVDTELADDFDFTAEPYKFSVAQGLLFVDVTPDMYYYGSVMTAYDNGYVKGYSNGKLYGPTDSMSRADVAVVLYRMSGAKASSWAGENSYSELTGWDTGYEDCNNKAYYAEAVAWARKAGVVAGLDDTHFGPDQKVTREQFATMLANYAKARGDFKTADESVLDKYADADQVSAFARGTVAWAVEEGVMGGAANLMPTSEVTRADVAVMAVNYQPASLVGIDLLKDWPVK